MNKIKTMLAVAGMAALVAACGSGGGEESGQAPVKTQEGAAETANAVKAPMDAANAAVADVAAATEAAQGTHTLTFVVEGMT